MPYVNPMHNPKSAPTKDDLEHFLGLGRYRRFEIVYDELIAMDLSAQMVWSELEKSWFIRFHHGKAPIFSIKWGIDNFYAYLDLKIKDQQQVVRHKEITSGARDLLQRNPPNRTKSTIPIEANLEMMRDQEEFLELLPVLIKVLA